MVESCIHAANIFYLVSYLVRDMLWLRLLTCSGLLLGIAFFTFQSRPMYGPCVWQILFLVINLWQIRQLVLERRRLKLSREEEVVGEAAFEELSREEMLTLLTRVMYENPTRISNIHRASRKELTPEEQVLRDIAFRGLSRKEMLNLLTRKLWGSLNRVNPAAWVKRRKTARGGAA
ncbi:hypothetical protein [Limnoglobus roseus]|uniref:POPDC1-3 domain-containing protein n=1 Tax=Limnoglobus roseus TaxID=2598579 RepID=A0A5C1AT52_9BACT|nr:hypothetical protein [Limnoglobus roseus]QEL20772.1 hypothetical protein PX52LOC_07888 [Limnoglobus roseus]